MLNEVYPLPYFFDIVAFELITNEALKKHIIEQGIEVYYATDVAKASKSQLVKEILDKL